VVLTTRFWGWAWVKVYSLLLLLALVAVIMESPWISPTTATEAIYVLPSVSTRLPFEFEYESPNPSVAPFITLYNLNFYPCV